MGRLDHVPVAYQDWTETVADISSSGTLDSHGREVQPIRPSTGVRDDVPARENGIRIIEIDVPDVIQSVNLQTYSIVRASSED